MSLVRSLLVECKEQCPKTMSNIACRSSLVAGLRPSRPPSTRHRDRRFAGAREARSVVGCLWHPPSGVAHPIISRLSFVSNSCIQSVGYYLINSPDVTRRTFSRPGCHKASLSTLIICHLTQSTPVLSICPLHTNSGCGKERRILIGPHHGDLPRQHSLGTTLRFTGPVPAESRQ